MSQQTWTAVDDYFNAAFIADDDVMEKVLQSQDDAGLPAINVAPNQGKLLMLLARMVQAMTVLEVGTLGGYSTIWMARGLPADGHVTTLELDPKNAEVARKNFELAAVGDRITVRVGAALDSLKLLANEEAGPFDMVFIDADKENNTGYFDWALRMSHPGTLVIVDNVVRGGNVVDSKSPNASVQGVRRLVDRIADEPCVIPVALQTVGSKGYDGLAIMLVVDC